jgi:hypothetical protein
LAALVGLVLDCPYFLAAAGSALGAGFAGAALVLAGSVVF